MSTSAAALSSKAEEIKARAARLVDECFVLIGVEAPASLLDGRMTMHFTGLQPFEDRMIEDWRRQGYSAFIVPQGIADVVNLCPVADPMESALRVFGRWNAFVAAHAEDLMLVTRRNSFGRAQASKRMGLIAGTHQAGEIFRTVDDVDFFHEECGLRHGMLTAFGQNRLGTAVDEGEGRDGGLTRFGRACVERMNKVGMAIDVSHAGLKTRRETIEASSKPVLITHGNAAAICPTPRNNSDEMLKALAANGGVIGLMFWRGMVRHEEPVTVEHVVDHFDHVSQLIGPQHVGLATENPMVGFDACENVVGIKRQVSYVDNVRSLDIAELCGHDRIRTLTEALIRRGYGDDEIAGFLGGNFRRAFETILPA
jgi:membrane dipeptidase